MVALASPADLATYLQTATQAQADAGASDILDTSVALQALESASASIRAVCGWSISQETTTLTVSSSAQSLFLPSLHVTAVSVSSNGTPLDSARFGWSTSGKVWWLTALWGPNPGVTITYTHGYDPVPEVVRAVCLEQAAETYQNPQGLVSATFGNVSQTFSSRSTASASLDSDPRLLPYKLPAVA